MRPSLSVVVRYVTDLAAWFLSILADVKQTAFANVLTIAVSFATSVLAARMLGPAQRGELAAAVVYVALASSVADGGMNQAVPYFAARQKSQASAVLGTTCAIALCFGSVVALVTHLLLSWGGFEQRAVSIYLPSIPFGLLTTHLAGYMYGGDMLTRFNVVRVLQAALLLVALILAAAVRRPEVWMVLTFAVSSSVALAIATVVTLGRRVSVSEWSIDVGMAKSLLSYAVQSYIGNLCWLFNSRLDQLVMSVVLSSAALGIYATAVSYAGVVFSFFSVFGMLAFAKASAGDGDDEPRVRGIVRHYMVVSLITGVPTAAAMALAAPFLYPVLFGREFQAGVGSAMILCAGGVLLGLNFILSNGLRIRNQPLRPSIAEAIGVVVASGGLFYALPRFGIAGAAVVSVLSYAIVFAVLLRVSRQRGPAPAHRAASAQ